MMDDVQSRLSSVFIAKLFSPRIKIWIPEIICYKRSDLLPHQCYRNNICKYNKGQHNVYEI